MPSMEDQQEWYGIGNDGAQAMKQSASDRWPTLLENGYENGGICNAEEPVPIQQQEAETKMFLLNIWVDDQLQVYSYVDPGPQPLQSQLREIVDQLRLVVNSHKQGNTHSLSSTDSGSISPVTRTVRDLHAFGPSRLSQGHTSPLITKTTTASSITGGGNTPTSPLTSVAGQKRQAPFDAPEPLGATLDRSSQPSTGSKVTSPFSLGQPMNRSGNQRDREAEKEESDEEANTRENVREIRLDDHENLSKFYESCFRRIQQTACRQIAQVFVKTAHPKKQTLFPYNGNKRGCGGSAGGGSEKTGPERGNSREGGNTTITEDTTPSIPAWWPDGVPHKEPAHMKTPERMKLLMHILCNLRDTPGVGKKGNGVIAAQLQEATETDLKEPKISRRAKRWLAEIFRVRTAEEQKLDGCTREMVSVHWPSDKRTKRRLDGRRLKIEDEKDDNRVALFEGEFDTGNMNAGNRASNTTNGSGGMGHANGNHINVGDEDDDATDPSASGRANVGEGDGDGDGFERVAYKGFIPQDSSDDEGENIGVWPPFAVAADTTSSDLLDKIMVKPRARRRSRSQKYPMKHESVAATPITGPVSMLGLNRSQTCIASRLQTRLPPADQEERGVGFINDQRGAVSPEANAQNLSVSMDENMVPWQTAPNLQLMPGRNLNGNGGPEHAVFAQPLSPSVGNNDRQMQHHHQHQQHQQLQQQSLQWAATTSPTQGFEAVPYDHTGLPPTQAMMWMPTQATASLSPAMAVSGSMDPQSPTHMSQTDIAHLPSLHGQVAMGTRQIPSLEGRLQGVRLAPIGSATTSSQHMPHQGLSQHEQMQLQQQQQQSHVQSHAKMQTGIPSYNVNGPSGMGYGY